ncbi:MAG TPA: 3-oxoacyl-ACP reductase family protein [Candidatus Polarisedimenticolaceae bacterium]|nr:3-oxoacyl-ACP reductase family protein [Candidatus Polarisedimenticolaceae bacterium]
MIDLTGKSALVTGGARGIGRACCLMLARAGASVAVNYRVESPSAALLVEEIEGLGGEAFALAADVARREDAEMMVDEAVSRFGGLDILVNNAGIWKESAIDEMSDGEWGEMLAVNLTGTFHCIRAAVPAMKEARGGRIVNVSSTAGQRGEAFHAHYAATKGAVISMTKSLAVELAPHGILVNCVAPGWTVTDLTREELLGPARDTILKAIPLGRAATPEEIAGAVVFLASELSTFITGEVLNVNGGAVLVG